MKGAKATKKAGLLIHQMLSHLLSSINRTKTIATMTASSCPATDPPSGQQTAEQRRASPPEGAVVSLA